MFVIWYPIILLLFLGGAVASFPQDAMEYQVDGSKLLKLRELSASKVRIATPFWKIHPERFPRLFPRTKPPLPRVELRVFQDWIPGTTDHVIRKYPIHLNEADPRIACTMLLNPAAGNYMILEKQAVPSSQGQINPMPRNGGRWFFPHDSPGKIPFEINPPKMWKRIPPDVKEKPKGRGER